MAANIKQIEERIATLESRIDQAQTLGYTADKVREMMDELQKLYFQLKMANVVAKF